MLDINWWAKFRTAHASTTHNPKAAAVALESHILFLQWFCPRKLVHQSSLCTEVVLRARKVLFKFAVRHGLLDNGLASGRPAKKPHLTKKNIRDWLELCRKYRDWVAEDWCKVVFLMELPPTFKRVWKDAYLHKKKWTFVDSCIVPTVKHPETIHGLCGVASHLAELAHSPFCQRIWSWTKNGIKKFSGQHLLRTIRSGAFGFFPLW